MTVRESCQAALFVVRVVGPPTVLAAVQEMAETASLQRGLCKAWPGGCPRNSGSALLGDNCPGCNPSRHHPDSPPHLFERRKQQPDKSHSSAREPRQNST